MRFTRDPRPSRDLGPAADHLMGQMVQEGRPWAEIGTRFGIPARAAREYAEGLPDLPPWRRGLGFMSLGCDDAMPAGHPVSWSILTAGTILEGAPYV